MADSSNVLSEEERRRIEAKVLDRVQAVTVAEVGQEPRRYVPADTYLAELDRANNLDRTLHLIAAHTVGMFRADHPVNRILADAGIDPGVAAVIAGWINAARRGEDL